MGLDYKTTFDNLFKAGHWDCMSEQEKDIFLSEIKKVNIHEEKNIDEQKSISGFTEFVEAFANPEDSTHRFLDYTHTFNIGDQLLGMSMQRLTEIIDLNKRRK